MKTPWRFVFSVGVVLIPLSATVHADNPDRVRLYFYDQQIWLLKFRSVHQDLKMTGTVGLIPKYFKQNRKQILKTNETITTYKALADNHEKFLKPFLKPDQRKRLAQLSYRSRKARAFQHPDVMKVLQLSQQQISQIQSVNDKIKAKEQKIEERRTANRLQQNAAITRLHQDGAKQILKSLNDGQKAKWKELLGKPLK